MNQGSNIYAELPPTKLFFRCAVPAAVTSAFGTLYYEGRSLNPRMR